MRRSARDWIEASRYALRAVGDYFSLRSRGRQGPITSNADLVRFLATRSSFVAQTALYGYLRTRAGMRYPTLFDDDAFAHSINIAKWYLWLACLSDLSVYTGGLIALRTGASGEEVGALMRDITATILTDTGVPDDAGPDFAAHVRTVETRLAGCDWHAIDDDDSAFSRSPEALVEHAPIIRELMALDEEIVRNSVRFRWHEVRRDLRRHLDGQAILDGDAEAR